MIIIKIGFIGSGKVGFSLGKYLKEKGFNVVGYFSKSRDSIDRAVKFTNTKPFYKLKDLVSSCDILFITTIDSEIQSVWESLKGLSIKNKIICHCSGSLSSEIFNEREKYNVFGYSVHPLFPIKDKYTSYKSLGEAPVSIEGDEEYLGYIVGMFIKLGNKVKIINAKDKIKYHCAAVITSNLVVSLIDIGVEKLLECGFTKEDAIQTLKPLIKNNVENIFENGVEESLTGPIERGDITTVKKHLNVLEKEDKKIYIDLSKRALKIGKNKNKNKNYSKMEDFLCQM